ncbi:hypothetical protein PAHAL_5G531500 [Panicum hallii]|uniref:Cytochrome P450 n=1 Tax=Panicum hallii TaxID=206008 RepID=A0A2S3HZ83_9POAL|nr:hypothetical protein PAHAL_5G531500 [Panicum hallii]
MAVISLVELLITVVAVVPIIFALLLLSSSSSRKRADGRRQPPSPPGLPLLGHLHLLGRLPHRALRSLAASHGPVMLLRLGRVPTVVASSAAAAEEAMKTRDLAFSGRPMLLMAQRLLYGGRDVGFAPYGEYWRQAPREVAALVARVRHEAAAGGAVNLSDFLICYSKAIISRAAFGDGDYGLDGDEGGEKLRRVFADFQELVLSSPMRESGGWTRSPGWRARRGARSRRSMACSSGSSRTTGAGVPVAGRFLLTARSTTTGISWTRWTRTPGSGSTRTTSRQSLWTYLLPALTLPPLHGAGMGHGGAHQPPARDAEAPGRGPRRRRPRNRGPPRRDGVPQGRDQRDHEAARPGGAPDTDTPRDDGGHRAAGLLHPGAHAGGDQRLGHRPGPGVVGARGGVRAGAVRRRARGLQQGGAGLPGTPLVDVSEVFGLSVRLKAPLVLVAKPWSG